MLWLGRVGGFCRGRGEGLENVGLGSGYMLLVFPGRRRRMGREERKGGAFLDHEERSQCFGILKWLKKQVKFSLYETSEGLMNGLWPWEAVLIESQRPRV